MLAFNNCLALFYINFNQLTKKIKYKMALRYTTECQTVANTV